PATGVPEVEDAAPTNDLIRYSTAGPDRHQREAFSRFSAASRRWRGCSPPRMRFSRSCKEPQHNDVICDRPAGTRAMHRPRTQCALIATPLANTENSVQPLVEPHAY